MEKSGSITLNDQEFTSNPKRKSFFEPVFFYSGKFASEIVGLSEKASELVSQKFPLINIKKGYLVDKLLHTDILFFRKTVEFSPQSAGANYNLAMALLNDQRFNEAALYFKRATIWDFRNKNAYLGMAKAYQELGQNDKTIEALKALVIVDEKDAAARYELGIAFEKNGLFKEAVDSFKYAVVLRENFKEALDALTSLQEARGAIER